MTANDASAGPADAEAATEAIEPAAEAPLDAPVDAPVVPAERLLLRPSPGPMALTDPLSVAGRKAMWTHLDRMLAREPGVRDPERPDELRKYRVAIRRLRAALRMFAPAYPEREVRPLRRGLGELARAVGAARDLDLRIAHLDRWAVERGGEGQAAVAILSTTWARDRRRAMRALLAMLDQRRHRRFVHELIRFVDQSPATDGAGGRRRASGRRASTVGDRLASQLWTAYEDVRAFAPILDGADLETIHDLRIAGKRFRDDLEFLAGVLPPERAWLTDRLVALQDHLGALNDATVGVAAIRLFLERRWATLTPREQAEIGAYLSEREGEVASLRQSIWRPWRPIAGIGFARRLARLVVVRPAAP